MKFNIWPVLLLALLTSGCTIPASLDRAEILIGTWQMEDKNTFENWEKKGRQLHGKSYQLDQETETIKETLSIKVMGKAIIYEATVPTQNDGRSIPFTLNPSVTDRLSFENANHDFPQKIQYRKVDKDRLEVHVLGEGDQGFSYFLVKKQER